MLLSMHSFYHFSSSTGLKLTLSQTLLLRIFLFQHQTNLAHTAFWTLWHCTTGKCSLLRTLQYSHSYKFNKLATALHVYLTRFVIARISGLFLYGFASWESNGLIPDFINMLASTRYFRHVVRLHNTHAKSKYAAKHMNAQNGCL